jgi:hypothetical protein
MELLGTSQAVRAETIAIITEVALKFENMLLFHA